MISIQSNRMNSLLSIVQATGILPSSEGDIRLKRINVETINVETIQLGETNLSLALKQVQDSQSPYISLNGIVFSKQRAIDYIQKMNGYNKTDLI